MENIEINETNKNEITLDLNAQSYLFEAGKWAHFLGILGFIFCGLIALGSIAFGIASTAMHSFIPNNPGFGALQGAIGFVMVGIYLLMAVFYFFFSFYLYQFGNKIKNGIIFNNSFGVATGLEKLKSFFKLWGISTIVIIGLYILIIIGALFFTTTMQH